MRAHTRATYRDPVRGAWRWGVCALVVAVLVALPFAVRYAPVSVPDAAPVALLARIQASATKPYAGYAESTGALALPTTDQLDDVATLTKVATKKTAGVLGDDLALNAQQVAGVRAEEGAEAMAALADAGPVLELGPLPAAAVAELARRFGVADLAGPVLERARGHTLFTVESLRAAAEGGRDLAAVPASLRDAVLTRARRAGPEAETLLRAAAVVGAAFDLEVVAGLLDLPVEVAAARAEQALAARLLVEDDTGAGYRFANDLVREVLYATSPRPTRVSPSRPPVAGRAGSARSARRCRAGGSRPGRRRRTAPRARPRRPPGR